MVDENKNKSSMPNLSATLASMAETAEQTKGTITGLIEEIYQLGDYTQGYIKTLEQARQAGLKMSSMTYGQIKEYELLSDRMEKEIKVRQLLGEDYIKAEANARKMIQINNSMTEEEMRNIDKLRIARQESFNAEKEAMSNMVASIGNFITRMFTDVIREAKLVITASSSLSLSGEGLSRSGTLGGYSKGIDEYNRAQMSLMNLGYNSQASRELGMSMTSSNTFMDNTKLSKDYADAMIDAAKNARAFGISTTESAKIMKDSFRYNDGEYKQIMAGLNQVMSETSFNGQETVTNFSKLNSITSRYANNMQSTTTLMSRFYEAIQKGQIGVEQLDFSTRKQPLGKDAGLAYLAGMSEQGQRTLQRAGVGIGGNPLDTESQMFRLNETKEGQIQLLNIMREAMKNLTASTGESEANQRLLLQRGIANGLIPSNLASIMNSLTDKDLERLMNNEITLDKKTWSTESQDKYKSRVKEMQDAAFANALVERPEIMAIKAAVEKIGQAVKGEAINVTGNVSVDTGMGEGIRAAVRSLGYLLDPRDTLASDVAKMVGKK